jgi:catechol 2,3-dioxygenase-like lactoylglutathione lyase family enzyme
MKNVEIGNFRFHPESSHWATSGLHDLNPERRSRMFNHVMVGSNDIERSKRFYDAVLATLGAGEPFRNDAASGHTRLFYRHDGNIFCVTEPINDEEATPANGGTIGFKCNSPEQVQQFHDTAVAHGGTSIEDPPGLREGSLGAMHLAYVRDPDGNKLCAIYRAK